MPRPVRPWFRVYAETFSDRKILRLTPTQRWLWIAVLGAARESPDPGHLMIAEGVPMTQDELARYADVRPRDVAPALETMRSLGMLTVEGALISVCNWGSRQYESDNVTARTAAHRERSKEQGSNVPTNVLRNTPETETETETETERDLALVPRSEAKSRGQRLPDGWMPSPQLVSTMQQECPSVDLDLEHRKFTDYWNDKAGKDATRINWDGTWRNWIRNARPSTQRQQDRRQQQTDDIFSRAQQWAIDQDRKALTA